MIPYKLRLHLYFARQAEKAVILRQGPSRVFRMILWDTATDRFEDGQWLKRKIVTDACDLSPDGRHFLYFSLDGRWGNEAGGSYTVISRPPWFTGLALWPLASLHGGGGRFLDNRYVEIDTAAENHDIIGNADGLERVYPGPALANNRTGYTLGNGQRVPFDRQTRQDILNGRNECVKSGRYQTEDGKLFRIVGEGRELIRDFSDMQFEAIVAPYDDRPVSGKKYIRQAWHPLNGEKE